MEIEQATKDIKIEDLFCGVMSLETLEPCKAEGLSLITVEAHSAILCLCEKHAIDVIVHGLGYIVQETTESESKRYFGVEFSPQTEEVG